MKILRIVLAALLAVGPVFGARATQKELIPPTSGIYTGVQFSQLLGDAFRSLASCNKGSSAPANVSGAAADGLCWIDDSVTPWLIKRYASGAWIVEGAIDPSNGLSVPPVGGGTATIASASSIDLGSVPQAAVFISGTTNITSFGSSAPAGSSKFICFQNALTLIQGSLLKIQGGYSVKTSLDDCAQALHLGSGTWRIFNYTRANGIPLDISAVADVKFNQAADIPDPTLYVFGYGQALPRTSFPTYAEKVTRVQNGTRLSGNATITGLTDTSGVGAGMPVESTGVTAGCVIGSKTSNSITLNSSSCVTASGTSTVSIFLTGYGSGGSATTVGVADCQGRTIAGRNDMSGSSSNRLTLSYFGADATIMNASGGREDQTLTVGMLPASPPSISAAFRGDPIAAPNAIVKLTGVAVQTGGPSLPFPDAAGSPTSGIITVAPIGTPTGAVDLTIGNLGSGNKYPAIGPTVIANCIVRVVP
jgi:hypothetical protein